MLGSSPARAAASFSLEERPGEAEPSQGLHQKPSNMSFSSPLKAVFSCWALRVKHSWKAPAWRSNVFLSECACLLVTRTHTIGSTFISHPLCAPALSFVTWRTPFVSAEYKWDWPSIGEHETDPLWRARLWILSPPYAPFPFLKKLLFGRSLHLLSQSHDLISPFLSILFISCVLFVSIVL